MSFRLMSSCVISIGALTCSLVGWALRLFRHTAGLTHGAGAMPTLSDLSHNSVGKIAGSHSRELNRPSRRFCPPYILPAIADRPLIHRLDAHQPALVVPIPDRHRIGRIVDPGFAVDAVGLRQHVFGEAHRLRIKAQVAA